MGSYIHTLKQTMDLAFGKMQSALFMCEMRSKDKEWKLTIEKDVMSISIGCFMRDFQENTEAKVKRDENQWKDTNNEKYPHVVYEEHCKACSDAEQCDSTKGNIYDKIEDLVVIVAIDLALIINIA
ncbi:hypothetical protein JHK87_012306 [Glycine soja]|nr:hypothetical protein JHK87_012306 [Glycine soja]